MERHCISGAMLALMDVDRRAIKPEGRHQCMCCWHVAAADSGGCASNEGMMVGCYHMLNE